VAAPPSVSSQALGYFESNVTLNTMGRRRLAGWRPNACHLAVYSSAFAVKQQ
jgi:hypothetical protein